MSWRFLAGRTRELEISRLTNSGVPKPSEVPSFLLRARRNKQLLAQALSVKTFSLYAFLEATKDTAPRGRPPAVLNANG